MLKKLIFAENSLRDGGSKGEKAERLTLDSEHRLRRAQDKNQEAFLAQRERLAIIAKCSIFTFI